MHECITSIFIYVSIIIRCHLLQTQKSGFICCSTSRQQIIGTKFIRAHTQTYNLLTSIVVCTHSADCKTNVHRLCNIDVKVLLHLKLCLLNRSTLPVKVWTHFLNELDEKVCPNFSLVVQCNHFKSHIFYLLSLSFSSFLLWEQLTCGCSS